MSSAEEDDDIEEPAAQSGLTDLEDLGGVFKAGKGEKVSHVAHLDYVAPLAPLLPPRTSSRLERARRFRPFAHQVPGAVEPFWAHNTLKCRVFKAARSNKVPPSARLASVAPLHRPPSP